MSYKNILNNLEGKETNVGIVGLGYVGLPLAVEFVRAGIDVTGLEISEEKVNSLKNGESYIQDIDSSVLSEVMETGNFHPTTDQTVLEKMDAVIICVPTPLRKSRDPDLSFIVKASETVAQNISKDTLVVLESTTYPGTTREILVPEFEKEGFSVGKAVFIAFSPERVDPGNKEYGIKNTPKVGGIDKKSLKLVETLYSGPVDKVVLVGSCEEAEMVKLLENTFRAINIGVVNELALLCDKLDLDIWNIIEAASTKPFGFMPFYPGPGLGGHCLPVDPQFLSWKAKSSQFYPHFIDYAEEVNRSMPEYVVTKISRLLNKEKKSVNGAKILIMGVSYKKNVGDVRESPAFEIGKNLKDMGADLTFVDPFVEEFQNIEKIKYKDIDYKDYDCVAVVTAHDSFDYGKMVNKAEAVMDCRGVTLGLEGRADIERL